MTVWFDILEGKSSPKLDSRQDNFTRRWSKEILVVVVCTNELDKFQSLISSYLVTLSSGSSC
jgi:hypothetical protein